MRRISENHVFFLGIAFFIIGGIIVFAIIQANGEEAEREVRNYGDLTCVYNVDEDEVEACR